MFFLAFDVTTACWSGQLSNKFNAAQSLVRGLNSKGGRADTSVGKSASKSLPTSEETPPSRSRYIVG
jgi:hypothetical protein